MHGRVWLVRWGVTDLIGRRIIPITDRPGYAVGSVGQDTRLLGQLGDALPGSLLPAELARSLHATAQLYSDLVVDWAVRTATDPRGIVRDPDPKSRNHAIRLIGHSASAGFVITVILTPSDHAGVTAWKTSGADLRAYDGQEMP